MFLKKTIKQYLYPYIINQRCGAAVQAQLRQLFFYYIDCASINKKIAYSETGLRVFSTMEEDGILLWLLATLQINTGHFLDIGSHNCINSNCANLAFNFGWHGTFIDADKKNIALGKKLYGQHDLVKNGAFQFVQAFVSPSNINAIVSQHLIEPEVDFASIDIDGNDYWIWKALEVVRPKIVMIENKVEYGMYNFCTPYQETGGSYLHRELGASPFAITELAHQKNYTLVAANRLGFNTIYLRNDLVTALTPAIHLHEMLAHPACAQSLYTPEKMDALIKQMQ